MATKSKSITIKTRTSRTPKAKKQTKVKAEQPKIRIILEPHELSQEDFNKYIQGHGDYPEQTLKLRSCISEVFSHTRKVPEGYWKSHDFKAFHKVFVEKASRSGQCCATAIESCGR